MLLLATVINFGGTKILSYAAIAGFTAEIAGAIVVGGWLLLFNRENNFGVLFDSLAPAVPVPTCPHSPPPP